MQFVSTIRPLIQHNITHKVWTIHSQRLLWEQQWSCTTRDQYVGTKSRGIKVHVTCISTGDKGRPTKVCTMTIEHLGSGLWMKAISFGLRNTHWAESSLNTWCAGKGENKDLGNEVEGRVFDLSVPPFPKVTPDFSANCSPWAEQHSYLQPPLA